MAKATGKDLHTPCTPVGYGGRLAGQDGQPGAEAHSVALGAKAAGKNPNASRTTMLDESSRLGASSNEPGAAGALSAADGKCSKWLRKEKTQIKDEQMSDDFYHIVRLCDELCEILGQSEAIADCRWLIKRHPEMFDSMKRLADMLDEVTAAPDITTSPKKYGGVLAAKILDEPVNGKEKMGEVGISPEGKVFHANMKRSSEMAKLLREINDERKVAGKDPNAPCTSVYGEPSTRGASSPESEPGATGALSATSDASVAGKSKAAAKTPAKAADKSANQANKNKKDKGWDR